MSFEKGKADHLETAFRSAGRAFAMGIRQYSPSESLFDQRATSFTEPDPVLDLIAFPANLTLAFLALHQADAQSPDSASFTLHVQRIDFRVYSLFQRMRDSVYEEEMELPFPSSVLPSSTWSMLAPMDTAISSAILNRMCQYARSKNRINPIDRYRSGHNEKYFAE
jgi:hypothetical protein